MEIKTLSLRDDNWVVESETKLDNERVDLVLVFGDTDELEKPEHFDYLRKTFANAKIAGTSTAGNIQGPAVSDNLIVATAIAFKHSRVMLSSVDVTNNTMLEADARRLIEQLPQEGLRYVFVMADGLLLNGSLMAKGLNSVNRSLTITGGMAGDGFRFDHTVIIADAPAKSAQAVAVGFYGDDLHVAIGCESGWNEFGAERIVTRSEGNIVYEIDDKPALSLYEDYLGEYIKDLPASGLYFPLNIKKYYGDKEVVRVMMGINDDGSVVFAGDVPQNSIVRLMKTNVNNLIEGAGKVADTITAHNNKQALALTVSCSGRRNVLKQLADAELEAVQDILGDSAVMSGFYSYGEFAPFSDDLQDCKLHNQTMTLTVIYED